MDRVSGTGGGTAGTVAAAAPGRAVKPGVAFKQAMARAMEGWGPDAPAAQLRARPMPAAARA
ncbi:MAG: hypothetical protein K2X49_04285, partial [Acetobacteraceae bacterium]|nr:hypothetical protein [Acetobacteraceae bacterium]